MGKFIQLSCFGDRALDRLFGVQDAHCEFCGSHLGNPCPACYELAERVQGAQAIAATVLRPNLLAAMGNALKTQRV